MFHGKHVSSQIDSPPKCLGICPQQRGCFFVEWIIGVRLTQQELQGTGDLRQVDGWNPVFSNQVQTHTSIRIDIRVEDLWSITWRTSYGIGQRHFVGLKREELRNSHMKPISSFEVQRKQTSCLHSIRSTDVSTSRTDSGHGDQGCPKRFLRPLQTIQCLFRDSARRNAPFRNRSSRSWVL